MSELAILVAKPRPQIVRASLTSTSLVLSFGITPDPAANKTTANAAVVADCGVKSKRYKSIGTVSIAPPAPTNPRMAPMKQPAIRPARISMK